VSYRIVGIVRDTKHMNLREAAPRFVFLPMRQPRDVEQRVTLVLASSIPGRERDLLSPVRNTLAGIDPGILVSDVITMRRQLDSTLLTERMLSGLSMTFGLLAMLLAAIGLYGALSYRVGRQRHAIGIRMALGASPSTVAVGVLRQSGVVVGLGLIAGLPFAVMGARIAGSMLWGVTSGDPLIYAACCVILCLVGLLSAYVPARRAAAVQPIDALRHN
jgi:ABC-type antimicrobial peptide transport system permease subunit